ncbi:UDP-4-amino-4,6-dideoxy-N-acetyl-beta-L-altrosamine transaminase [Paenibacillus planticolens]|uniref:UDP-4-amino-4, 6-dideoxy-N-acetyl-beta-L-altrosamine transaminase n=1 Tax=Paenibacillus planticolens TaxID=2654976 RepID=A0ABX1ZKU7_9BACL|nr:UDP-4-amino-4,6-dideoxy-N-acetyl-beta-L-altrosamine transaminase [Paenibacillus planticolens]NOV00461.1 UDP-4-amino-4,6-dideoxy-N-acetyl-beta-L-altrosamine transaminase [Paenibacillus planticolens]
MEELALEGGQPVRKNLLPYGKQWLDENDRAAVLSVLESDFITQGPMIPRFEEAVATYVGAKFAVAFCNGTAALHAACFAAEIGNGDEVITTPITFLASSNCVLYQGGTPVFADIKPDTYNIDPVSIESKITSRTKAIIAVDFTGQPVEVNEIHRIARDHNLLVIQDAAHSLGAKYSDKKVGSLADMTMFSFHPVKHITTGEGGVITTDSQRLYEKLLLFRNHGMTRNQDIIMRNEGPWYYEMHELGYNYRMTDLQAALGLSQLNRLDDFVERRREIAMKYQNSFIEMPGIQIPYQHPQSNSSWHLYVIRFKKEAFDKNRRDIFAALRAENIGVNVHYIPVYRQPYYQQIGYEQTHCVEAESYYEEAITLPLFPRMTNEDVQDVVRAVKKIYDAYLRTNIRFS